MKGTGAANAKLTTIAQQLVLEDVAAKARAFGGGGKSGGRLFEKKNASDENVEHSGAKESAEETGGRTESHDSADVDLANLRERRLAELKARQRQWETTPGGGSVRKMTEQEFMSVVLHADRIVCLFYVESFAKCQQMAALLTQLAPQHGETLFAVLEAEKCPFLVAKMAIRVLPTTLLFLKGALAASIVGFEGITSGTDAEKPSKAKCVKRLAKFCIIRPAGVAADGGEGSSSDGEGDDH